MLSGILSFHTINGGFDLAFYSFVQNDLGPTTYVVYGIIGCGVFKRGIQN